MPPTASPIERARRRGVDRLVLLLVLLVLLVRAGRGLGRALSTPRPPGPLPPMEVDVARDPATRLVLLPGIGKARAEAILADRRRRGPVASLDDLVRVPGIGRATVQRLRDAVEVRAVAGGDATTPPSGR